MVTLQMIVNHSVEIKRTEYLNELGISQSEYDDLFNSGKTTDEIIEILTKENKWR